MEWLEVDASKDYVIVTPGEDILEWDFDTIMNAMCDAFVCV